LACLPVVPIAQRKARDVGFEEIAIDLSEFRFGPTSGLPTIRELMATRAFIAHDLPEADLSLTWFC
jgi:hypothetical protein